jgi:hypothetical protein
MSVRSLSRRPTTFPGSKVTLSLAVGLDPPGFRTVHLALTAKLRHQMNLGSGAGSGHEYVGRPMQWLNRLSASIQKVTAIPELRVNGRRLYADERRGLRTRRSRRRRATSTRWAPSRPDETVTEPRFSQTVHSIRRGNSWMHAQKP